MRPHLDVTCFTVNAVGSIDDQPHLSLLSGPVRIEPPEKDLPGRSAGIHTLRQDRTYPQAQHTLPALSIVINDDSDQKSCEKWGL